jgi:hypothetical protein
MVGELRFVNELAIPPLLERSETGGRKVFDLTMQREQAKTAPGKVAQTCRANRALPQPNPTIRARRPG